MAFRFKLDEPVERGFRRIGVEQIEAAEARLSAADGAEPEAVHAVRKSLKRVRALLRLVRPGLGEDVFAAENARYRDTGRLLAGARDRHVMLQTLTTLEARHGLEPNATARLKLALGGGATGPSEQVVRDARKALAQGRRTFRRLEIGADGFAPLTRGLEASMHSCRKRFHAAYTAPSDEAFHDWRKSVQAHWRHMLLLSRAWPGIMIARAHQARDISQFIGEDHDHGVLATYVASEVADVDSSFAARVADLCHARQSVIRRHVKPLGERLFVDGAKGLAGRVTVYWHAARAASATAVPEDVAEPAPKAGGRSAPGTDAPAAQSPVKLAPPKKPARRAAAK